MGLAIASVLLACCVRLPAQEFEAAAVKRNTSGRMQSSTGRSGGQLVFENVTLRECIGVAYGTGVGQDYALSGPAWLSSERYDIVAKVPAETPREQVLLMLRQLLTQRFHLKVHRETREMRVLSLMVARGGAKLKATSAGDGSFSFGPGHIEARALSMREFAERLSGPIFKLGVPIVDATGLEGVFEFSLEWAPYDGAGDAAGASIFAALQEQLGLKLEASRKALEILVVDEADRIPMEN